MTTEQLELINAIVKDVNFFAERNDYRLASSLKALADTSKAAAKATKATKR